MEFCSKCGVEIGKASSFCKYCGTKVGNGRGQSSLPLLSLIFGVIGLIILPIIFGLLAVVCGAVGRSSEGKSTANIGLALGIIDLVVGLLFLRLFI